MKITRPLRTTLKITLHATLILASFRTIFQLRKFTDLIPGVQLRIPPLDASETLIFAGLSALIFLFRALHKKFYTRSTQKFSTISTLTKTRIYRIISITFLAYFGRGFIFPGGISRFVIVRGAVSSFITISLLELFRKLLAQKFSKKSPPTRVISRSQDFLDKFLPFLALIDADKNYKVFRQLPDHAPEQGSRIILLPDLTLDEIQEIFDQFRGSSVGCFVVPASAFLDDALRSSETRGNFSLLQLHHSPLAGTNKIRKRFFDFFGAILLLIPGIPLMILIAIAIRLDSRGSPIFTQTRVGRSGKNFTFFKFRTMFAHLSTGEKFGGPDAEKIYENLIKSSNAREGILPKISDDPRVTRVGRRLRKTSLDELPQLFNVLIGTMSLVGPRPHLPREVQEYQDRHRRLLSVKPGITGHAQLFGRSDQSFDDEARHDLFYIRHRSVFLDFYVLILTLTVIFRGK